VNTVLRDYRVRTVCRDGTVFLAKKVKMLQFRLSFCAEIQDTREKLASEGYKEIKVAKENQECPWSSSQTLKATKATKANEAIPVYQTAII